MVADLNQLVNENRALHELDFSGEGFEWIDSMNSEDSILCYLRKGLDDAPPILICCNFTPVVREGYRVGVPQGGYWKEVFNSDSELYGGSNVGNYPGRDSLGEGHHGRPDSIAVDLPPLGVIAFRLGG